MCSLKLLNAVKECFAGFPDPTYTELDALWKKVLNSNESKFLTVNKSGLTSLKCRFNPIEEVNQYGVLVSFRTPSGKIKFSLNSRRTPLTVNTKAIVESNPAWLRLIKEIIGDETDPAAQVVKICDVIRELELTNQNVGPHRLALSLYWAYVLATPEAPYIYIRGNNNGRGYTTFPFSFIKSEVLNTVSK